MNDEEDKQEDPRRSSGKKNQTEIYKDVDDDSGSRKKKMMNTGSVHRTEISLLVLVPLILWLMVPVSSAFIQHSNHIHNLTAELGHKYPIPLYSKHVNLITLTWTNVDVGTWTVCRFEF